MTNLQAKSLGGNEFLDLDTAAATEVVVESSYDERDLALYALGVGAARNPLDTNDLRYVYELDTDQFQAIPTYAVMPPMNALLTAAKQGRNLLPGMNYGFDRVLHGEQYTEVKRPLPPSAKLKHTFRFKSAWDKDPNAVVTWAITTTDESGEELAYNETTTFVKGAGGWGGERGPSAPINVPPDREPDAVIEEKTEANQALLYRLSGDWNPLHIDPAFAKMFGFDRPILHGLCTYGHVARHVINSMLGGDARLFKSIQARFSDSVFPGETLVTRIWKESPTRFLIETRVKERDTVVLKNAAIEAYEEVPQPKPSTAKPAPIENQKSAIENPPPAAPVSLEPTSADIFAGISKYIAQTPGLTGQIQTVFQLKLTNPDSAWAIDMKNGSGACTPGTIASPDVTLEMSDANFIAMCLGKVDANKLYFGGELKIAGNIMASQKLMFLKKMDPALVEEAIRARLGGSAPAVATPSAAPATAPPPPTAPKESQSKAIFTALATSDANVLNGLTGHIVQFAVHEPEAHWTVDARGAAVKVESGQNPDAEATFGIQDDDLTALAKGAAQVSDLFQRGKLRVDGDVSLAHALGFLSKVGT
jgi:3-hydroxyacyl-CoA dehydrogenase/3a,7a,12a-trihydroxy-5b-cholest-24-enoyl-CoA hydratase